LEHVAVLALERVEAVRRREALDLLDDDAAVLARVRRDLTERILEDAEDDPRAELLVVIGERALDLGDRGDGADRRDAAARDDAFLDGRARRVESVLDARLLLLHLGLGGRADLDDGD